MWLIGCGERRDARTRDLREDTFGVGLRFQVACQGLGGVAQALGLTRLGRGRVQMSDLTPEL
jgi:hypothetical protein